MSTIVSFATDVARITNRGLLIEEGRTNLALRSQTLDNIWYAGTRASVSANAGTAPDGAVTADKLVESTDAATTHLLSSSAMTITGGATFSISIFAKASGRTWISIMGDDGTQAVGFEAYFNLGAGAVGATALMGTGSLLTKTIEAIGDGWYRCLVTGSLGGAGTSARLRVFLAEADSDKSFTGDGSSGVLLWGAQFEAGTAGTSYIATTSASATRAADHADFTLSSAPSAVLFQGVLNSRQATSRPFDLNDGSDTARILLQVSSAGVVSAVVTLAGVSSTIGTSAAGAVVAGTTFKALMRRNAAGTWRLFLNGAAVGAESAVLALPAVTHAMIGRRRVGGAEYLNGYVEALILFPLAPSDADCIALTTL